MRKYNIQERFFLFLAVTLMTFYGYYFYSNYKQDQYIKETMRENNRHVNRYLELYNSANREVKGLKHDLIHEQAMHEASKNHTASLEEQINLKNEYWRKEYVKVSDELFDLKNSKKKLSEAKK